MTELLTKEELLSIAVEHRKWLKNIKTWELHAQRHNLPSVATYEKCFGSWRATKNAVRLHPLYSNTDLIMIAERNAAHFTTISGWNEYADKNNLPNAFTFIEHFGTWNKAKLQCLGGRFDQNKNNQKQYLIAIARENKEYFNKNTEWARYAKQNNLPGVSTYIRCFGTWAQAKEQCVGLKVNKSKYSREILLEIGKNHLEHFKTAKHWDQYAQKNNLPKSWAFHTYFGTWQQAKRTLGLHGAGVKLTPLEVLKIAKENKEHFQSADRWNTYAEKHNLPKHSVFLKYFRTWNNAKELVHGYRIRTSTTGYTSASLLKIALEHKENFTTASNWEKYSKACKLPSATTYRNFFGTWNDAKNKLGLLAIKNSYTTQELIEIAKENKEHFSSMSNWNSHAKKKALPTGETYIKRFGSWKKSHKECLGTYNCTKIKYNYPKEMLLKIAKAHIENFTSVRSWSKYAKEHELPSIKPYVNQFGSWNEAKKAVGVDEIRYRKNYTTDELKQIAQKHKKYFTSISIWDKYARKHNLPCTVTYSNRFGSWNKAKKAVGASSS